MKKNALNAFVWSAAAFVLLGLASCAPDNPESVDFLMNNEAYLSLEDPTAALIDSSQTLRALEGDTVVFQDISKPENSIKSRVWSISVDGGSASKTPGEAVIAVPFAKAGLYKIQLCVNGETYCTTKCVLVETLPEVAPDTASVVEIPDAPPSSPGPIHSPPPAKKEESGKKTPVQQEKTPVAEKKTPIAIITPPTPVTVASPPEVKKVTKEDFSQNSQVSAAASARPVNSDCTDTKQSSFSVTLTPNKAVDLTSFFVFTDGCGSMRISLKGGDIDDEATVGLNKGRNDIKLGTLDDTRLQVGNTYTLTCTAVARSGSCPDDRTPRFEDAKECNLPIKNSPALDLDQNGHLFIYELKFRN